METVQILTLKFVSEFSELSGNIRQCGVFFIERLLTELADERCDCVDARICTNDRHKVSYMYDQGSEVAGVKEKPSSSKVKILTTVSMPANRTRLSSSIVNSRSSGRIELFVCSNLFVPQHKHDVMHEYRQEGKDWRWNEPEAARDRVELATHARSHFVVDILTQWLHDGKDVLANAATKTNFSK